MKQSVGSSPESMLCERSMVRNKGLAILHKKDIDPTNLFLERFNVSKSDENDGTKPDKLFELKSII
ncbi:hypothetical protein KY285_024224 [Solanum tuberosum]|nr:hypothetical protein KY289_024559 [Solanum tuberosum]KAH0673211.1 hypothetical protein KY284_024298 [Solanum tuberosum]KAH0676423.1 hypothetical protein KY285_024224 [Solanum tuberosum]